MTETDLLIGVLADTHVFSSARRLPDAVVKAFCDVNHIIHAGDIVGRDVISTLEKLAPVTAVAGNLDSQEFKQRYGQKKTLCVGRFRFGICHGDGKEFTTLQRALTCFERENVDCIVFGHSHQPYCAWHGNTLLFNPGSPTDKRRNCFFSFGLIGVSDCLLPRIVYF